MTKDITKITPYNSEATKKSQVEDMFDNIAPKYDLLNHVLSMKIDVLWRNTLVNWMKKDSPQEVLDVATGTGDLAIAVEKGTGSKVIGLDLSQQMLNVGVIKIKKLKLDGKISMQKGDAENLPFEDNRFDAVSVAFGVRNFENLQKGLSDMFRVTKPGGYCLVLEFSNPRNFPMKQLFTFYSKYCLPFLGKMISKDPSAYTYLPESVKAFPDGPEFIQIFKSVGYSETNWIPMTGGICSIYIGQKLK